MSVSQTLILPFICLRTNVLGRLVAAATYLHCVTVSVDRHGDLSRQASVRRLGCVNRWPSVLPGASKLRKQAGVAHGRNDCLDRFRCALLVGADGDIVVEVVGVT